MRMNGVSTAAIATMAPTLSTVSTFSVVPDSPMPTRFTTKNTPMTAISSASACVSPKYEKYCPRPAPIVAMPNTDDTKYIAARITEARVPNTGANHSVKRAPDRDRR